MQFAFIDWLVVFVYLAIILTVGMYIVKKPKTSESYFLADRKLRWPFIGASYLVSNVSAEHFVGLNGLAFTTGIVAATYEWGAVFWLIPLALLFVPLYINNKVFTIPEFLERRLSPGSRVMYSIFTIVLSIVQKLSIALWASGLVFHSLMGWDNMTVVVFLALAVAVYTMKGGLKAVVYTDSIQTTVLIVAGSILTIKALMLVGGWSGLTAKLPPNMLHMLKPNTDPEVPWVGLWFAMGLTAAANFANDQVLVQRVLAARDLNEGRKGVVFCQFLKILTPFVLVFPGLLAYALFKNEIGKADQAYPTMLMKLMPHGLLGLTVTGVAAALMGHLSATYNSVATMFTRDFYMKWRPDATHQKQIAVGRWAVLVVALLGIAWVPVVNNFTFLWSYAARMSGFIMMPYTVVFFLIIFWKRANSQGAWAAVITGLVLTPIMFLESMYHFIPILKDIPVMRPFLNLAFVNLAFCIIAMVIGTLLTPPPDKEKLATTMFNWNMIFKNDPPVRWYGNYLLWFGIVVAAAFAIVYRMR